MRAGSPSLWPAQMHLLYQPTTYLSCSGSITKCCHPHLPLSKAELPDSLYLAAKDRNSDARPVHLTTESSSREEG